LRGGVSGGLGVPKGSREGSGIQLRAGGVMGGLEGLWGAMGGLNGLEGVAGGMERPRVTMKINN
jgi:hypothetical protein